jgi:hypothetical protein
VPFPVAARLKTWFCGLSLAGITGSNRRREYGSLSSLSVVCCQVEVSATGWSLFQSSPTDCVVPECDCDASIMRRLWPVRGCYAIEKDILQFFFFFENPKRGLFEPVGTVAEITSAFFFTCLTNLIILRVSSFKTQLIYCQLKWRHVSTQGVIIRPIIDPCLRYIKWKFTLDVPQTWFNNWPNDDSLSRNMSPL